MYLAAVGKVINTLILWGAITWYAGPYVGEPLRCGGTYDATYTDGLAVDIDATGWRCGDLVRVEADGVVMMKRVRDSGYLSRYCVEYGSECVPIVADLPRGAWQWGSALSVQGSVTNVTMGLRARMERER